MRALKQYSSTAHRFSKISCVRVLSGNNLSVNNNFLTRHQTIALKLLFYIFFKPIISDIYNLLLCSLLLTLLQHCIIWSICAYTPAQWSIVHTPIFRSCGHLRRCCYGKTFLHRLKRLSLVIRSIKFQIKFIFQNEEIKIARNFLDD